jgi:predicted SnoaL-like aldol condensation-catalyzing enzyme
MRVRVKFALPFFLVILLFAQENSNPNKQLVTQFIETVYNQRKLNQIVDFIAPDYTEYTNGVTTTTAASVIKTIKFLEESASDFKLEIKDIIAEGDKVMVLWQYRGLNTEYNQQVALSGVYIARIVDNKITEGWQIFDNFTRMKQLGFKVTAPSDSSTQEIK